MFRQLVSVVAACTATACDHTPRTPPGGLGQEHPSPAVGAPRVAAPERGIYLDRAPGLDDVSDPRLEHDRIARDGLIAGFVDAAGRPTTGGDAHAAVRESEATYAELERRGDYAPETFAAWKARFGFPARTPGESLAAWRERAGVYVYVNVHELGLGRELGCSEFADHDEHGAPATGVACFVSNYGATFNNLDDAFADAVRGEPVRNTVCIAHIPSLPAGARVQFFVYGSAGVRQTWAQLDHMGPRPHPHVCTNCHGGEHDTELHLTRDARFLPTQPSHLWFGPDAPYDRASQEERVRRMNALAYGAGADGAGDEMLTSVQRVWLDHLYDGRIAVPGQAMAPAWAPPAWDTDEADRALWTQVVDPLCATCHAALDEDGRARIATPEAMFDAVAMSLCGTVAMPNAQATSRHLWRARTVELDGVAHPSAGDALLAWAGLSRDACPGLEASMGCVRGGVARHELCGNAASGAVCLPSGRCGPDLTSAPTEGYAQPIGYCTLDGARGCPGEGVCRPLASPSADGWSEGACYACGAAGQPACDD